MPREKMDCLDHHWVRVRALGLSASKSIRRARKSRDFTAGMDDCSDSAVSPVLSCSISRRIRTCRYFAGSPATALRTVFVSSTRANDWCGDSP